MGKADLLRAVVQRIDLPGCHRGREVALPRQRWPQRLRDPSGERCSRLRPIQVPVPGARFTGISAAHFTGGCGSVHHNQGSLPLYLQAVRLRQH